MFGSLERKQHLYFVQKFRSRKEVTSGSKLDATKFSEVPGHHCFYYAMHKSQTIHTVVLSSGRVAG